MIKHNAKYLHVLKLTPNRNGVPVAKMPTGTPFLCVPAHLHPGWNSAAVQEFEEEERPRPLYVLLPANGNDTK